MADCRHGTVFTFVLLLFSDLQYSHPINISETVAAKKTLKSARRKIDPKSNLTVNADLQILQILFGRSVKIYMYVYGSHTG